MHESWSLVDQVVEKSLEWIKEGMASNQGKDCPTARDCLDNTIACGPNMRTVKGPKVKAGLLEDFISPRHIFGILHSATLPFLHSVSNALVVSSLGFSVFLLGEIHVLVVLILVTIKAIHTIFPLFFFFVVVAVILSVGIHQHINLPKCLLLIKRVCHRFVIGTILIALRPFLLVLSIFQVLIFNIIIIIIIIVSEDIPYTSRQIDYLANG
mmetsp:Transcript_16407/g.40059  ORF Transcript_16407/g.40059 Transcript_16407/m.40059 type:complete len:211 (-) Transcript_16407:644-1276(-)